MEQDVTVFLTVASPLMRARLRATLAAAPGVRLIGEAGTAAEAATQLIEYQPQILLTERALLHDPAFDKPLGRRGAPRVVVATATDLMQVAETTPTEVRAVPFTLTPLQLAAELRRTLLPRRRPEAPVLTAELRERFRVTGPVAQPVGAPLSPTPVPAPRPAPARRRAPSPGVRHLSEELRRLRFQQRDAVTGLAGSAALEQAHALLPVVQEPAAVMRLEVRDAAGQPLAAPGTSLLRRVSATLQANVRSDDLICLAGQARFWVIMPGVGREEAIAVRARVGRAVDEACSALAATQGGRLALKMSIWEAADSR